MMMKQATTQNKTFSVYMHVFPNGKRYIGITSQKPIEKRWTSTGSGYKRCPKMWNAIKRFGWENVEHVVLYEGLEKSVAEAAEIALIAENDTIRNGYNIEHGGNVIGSHSEETRRRISEANKGRIVSEETRQKLSLINKGKTGDKNAFFGRHHTEAVRREHSAFMVGNQYNKGNHHTAEFKAWKSEQMHEKYKDGGNPKCKAVRMTKPNGSVEVFYSLRKAAEVAGVSPAAMHKYIHEERTINGCKWGYL